MMACRLIGTKPHYLNQYWFIVNRASRNKSEWILINTIMILNQENASLGLKELTRRGRYK